MISPMTTARPQQRYDHRLRELVSSIDTAKHRGFMTEISRLSVWRDACGGALSGADR
jgi:hypothetical protein